MNNSLSMKDAPYLVGMDAFSAAGTEACTNSDLALTAPAIGAVGHDVLHGCSSYGLGVKNTR